MPEVVVGLTGQKGSGKDTFAARLVENHGFTRVAFADALKDVALKINPRVYNVSPSIVGIDVWHTVRDPWNAYPAVPLRSYVTWHGWDEAKKNPEVRGLLQELGVAVRGLDEDIWVRTALERIDAVSGPVVVTDARFPNELDILSTRYGAWIVRIDRPLPDEDTHVSEHAWRSYGADVIIPNTGTVDDLHAAADVLAAELLDDSGFGFRHGE